jgi:hypothetical protein
MSADVGLVMCFDCFDGGSQAQPEALLSWVAATADPGARIGPPFAERGPWPLEVWATDGSFDVDGVLAIRDEHPIAVAVLRFSVYAEQRSKTVLRMARALLGAALLRTDFLYGYFTHYADRLDEAWLKRNVVAPLVERAPDLSTRATYHLLALSQLVRERSPEPVTLDCICEENGGVVLLHSGA